MNKLSGSISFTKNELKVIVFVVSVLVSGFVLKYYSQVIEHSANKPYDFSKSDSEFTVLSGKRYNNPEFYNESPGGSSDSIEKKLTERLLSAEDSLIRKAAINQGNSQVESGYEVVNINTASKDELTGLPGIGESTAEKIIIFREDKKGFRKPEDLMKVKGIGKKKFEKISQYIKTE